MRRALAVLALLGTSLVGVASVAAPAQARMACGGETTHGYVITDLHEHQMGCASARAHAEQLVLHGHVAGYECSQHHYEHHTHAGCHRFTSGHLKSFVFNYHPEAAT